MPALVCRGHNPYWRGRKKCSSAGQFANSQRRGKKNARMCGRGPSSSSCLLFVLSCFCPSFYKAKKKGNPPARKWKKPKSLTLPFLCLPLLSLFPFSFFYLPRGKPPHPSSFQSISAIGTLYQSLSLRPPPSLKPKASPPPAASKTPPPRPNPRVWSA